MLFSCEQRLIHWYPQITQIRKKELTHIGSVKLHKYLEKHKF